jgi:hypothetical protein
MMAVAGPAPEPGVTLNYHASTFITLSIVGGLVGLVVACVVFWRKYKKIPDHYQCLAALASGCGVPAGFCTMFAPIYPKFFELIQDQLWVPLFFGGFSMFILSIRGILETMKNGEAPPSR